MVVADLERPLFRQRHMRGERLVHPPDKIGDLLVPVDAFSAAEFLQMLLRQLQQRWEHDCRRCAGGIEVAILDGRVDSRICVALDRLQNSKQAAEHIGRVVALCIEFHSQYLLGAEWCFISGVVRFQNCGAAARDLLLCADAQRDAVEQSGRVAAAGQNGAQQVTGQLRCRCGTALLQVDGFPGQCPDGQLRVRVVAWAHDLQRLLVSADVPGKALHTVAQKKADGQPRSVRREARK